MFAHPGVNVTDDAADVLFRPPCGACKQPRAVTDEQPEVIGAIRRHGLDGNFFAGDFFAQPGEFAKRGGAAAPPYHLELFARVWQFDEKANDARSKSLRPIPKFICKSAAHF